MCNYLAIQMYWTFWRQYRGALNIYIYIHSPGCRSSRGSAQQRPSCGGKFVIIYLDSCNFTKLYHPDWSPTHGAWPPFTKQFAQKRIWPGRAADLLCWKQVSKLPQCDTILNLHPCLLWFQTSKFGTKIVFLHFLYPSTISISTFKYCEFKLFDWMLHHFRSESRLAGLNIARSLMILTSWY